MRLRTEGQIKPLGVDIDYGSRILALGSCFAGNMAARLDKARFNVVCNPFGVMFNPVSVAETVEALVAGRTFTKDDLETDGDLWFSFSHHGSFSDVTPQGALTRINESALRGAEALVGSDTVILTLGTAWVYEMVANGRVVANCHKQPASRFVRRRLTSSQVAETLDPLLKGPLAGKRVILTLSPVRHLGDGLEENSLSKATLRVGIEQAIGRKPRPVYFPAFELMTDDLRDYRFYDEDMVHPSPLAVDYIWGKFCAATMTPETIELAARVEKIVTAAAHRPFNADSRSHARFMESMLAEALKLKSENPQVDLSREINYFSR